MGAEAGTMMTKDEDFSVQCGPRPEQPGHNLPNQFAEIAHRTEYHPIRPPRSAALGWCNKPNFVAQSGNLARPIMAAGAALHANCAGRLSGKKSAFKF
jgi:hypothetical protein